MEQRYPKVGDHVNVIQKPHYQTGELTTGVVREVLTKSRFHPRGHKVRLESGIIGRVQSFVDPPRHGGVGVGEVGVQKQLQSEVESPVGERQASEVLGPDDLR